MKGCKKINARIDKRWVKIRKIMWDDVERSRKAGEIRDTIPDNVLSKTSILKNKNAEDWELYINKIPVQEILQELDKLPEYKYPTEQSSIFLLPDGKMVGSNILFSHHKILEKTVGVKLNTGEFFKHLVAMRIVRLTVDDSILYVNINTYVTKEQKVILRKFCKSKKYKDCVVDSYGRYTYSVTNKITSEYEYDVLGLKKPK